MPAVVPFEVVTERFHLTLPAEPEVTMGEETFGAVSATSTGWTIEGDDTILQVMEMNFAYLIDESSATGALDSMIAGVAERGNGVVQTDERLDMPDVVQARRTVITFPQGSFFVDTYVKDATIVSIMYGSSESSPPQEYLDVLSSFAFA